MSLTSLSLHSYVARRLALCRPLPNAGALCLASETWETTILNAPAIVFQLAPWAVAAAT
jgi:hypothetical protein